ncbi:MAG: ABC-F family ATP-binding cassette domain-containing protein [Flavobacteriaceae bacterium]|nr:ABC-F family ATP-binding cassette domain-containing protein [Flavobacteriaceae bacterium]
MNLLSVENISKSFSDKPLFENLSFGINKGQKIAFMAKNGSGKTTLLKIIMGKETPDEGQVVSRKGISIVHLEQDETFDEESTIEEIVFKTDNPVVEVIAKYEKAILDPEKSDALQEAMEQMEAFDAWDFESKYKQVLSKLKLDDVNVKISKLSGGQRKRLGLACALLKRPDLLILDEPTNHLDLEMIEWLEVFLRKEKMTLFIVTHDRYFLERVCDEILELDQGVLHHYKGNYSYFVEKKQQRLDIEQVTLGKVKNLFKKELDWMRRQPKARTTKSKSRIEDFKHIEEAAKKRRDDHKVQLEIDVKRLGNKIAELHNISMSFPDKKIVEDFRYIFKKGERIGIIGENGSGKSTFLNILTGGLPLSKGRIEIGETVKFGYYTQKGLTVPKGMKLIELIKEFGEYIPLKKGHQISAGQLLEKFLFSRKKQYDFIEKLSGGELKRLYLCTVLIQNPNFLVLDEPTNDLDIDTLTVLENFLLDFPGNLIVVTHDRYFMDKIVDSLFVFKGDGKIEGFPGNYSDYRAYEDSLPKESAKKAVKKVVEVKQVDVPKKSMSRDLQKEYKRLENDISKLEKKKESIEKEFETASFSQEEISDKSKELEETIAQIDSKEERWLELGDEYGL